MLRGYQFADEFVVHVESETLVGPGGLVHVEVLGPWLDDVARSRDQLLLKIAFRAVGNAEFQQPATIVLARVADLGQDVVATRAAQDYARISVSRVHALVQRFQEDFYIKTLFFCYCF